MTVLRILLRSGVRRGLIGGSRRWTLVGVAAGLAMLARRLVAEPPETVFRQRLDPGEGLRISVLPPDEPSA